MERIGFREETTPTADRGRFLRRVAGAVVTVSLAFGMSACGSEGNTTGSEPAAAPATDGSFNDADVTFAQGMLPHHLQAVEMARLAKSRAGSPGVKALAASILTRQQPEVAQLRQLLSQWGRSMDTSMESITGMESMRGMPGMESMEGMANLEATMSGMASSSEMAELRAATGREFDRLFLTMMLAHHRTAVKRAQTEQAEGKDGAAIALAKKIERAQTSEVARLEKLRAAVGSPSGAMPVPR